MADNSRPETTQRAYTLLLGGPKNSNGEEWRDALWRTHKAVNIGAKAFGDWLLTMKGGLSHKLADTQFDDKKKAANVKVPDEEIKSRRIILALSWLSVESKNGAPESFIISKDSNGKWETVKALGDILKKRGLQNGEINEWINDCKDSIEASIRDDAVWVNRSMAFDEAVKNSDASLNDVEAWDLIGRFYEEKYENYLSHVKSENEDNQDQDHEKDKNKGDRENTEAIKKKNKDFVKSAAGWLSERFGKGQGTDNERKADIFKQIFCWANNSRSFSSGKKAIEDLSNYLNLDEKKCSAVISHIGSKGRPDAPRKKLEKIDNKTDSPDEEIKELADYLKNKGIKECKSKIGKKGKRQYANILLEDVQSKCGLAYSEEGKNGSLQKEFSVILDHAARHVCQAFTWIKKAEAQRQKFENNAEKIKQVPEEAKNWLDNYCQERSGSSGSIDCYIIKKRAIEGWDKVVLAWSRKDCKNEEDRISAARELQSSPDIDKFGDIGLFESLTSDKAKIVWQNNGSPDPDILKNYSSAREAEYNKKRFKVPAYRHPDPLLHPVFCDFGKSRWKIEYAAHKVPSNKKNIDNHPGALWMTLWNGSDIQETELVWRSKRMINDLSLNQQTANNGSSVDVSRSDRLGRAAVGANEDDSVKILSLFEQEEWNGRLQAPRKQLNEIAKIRDSNKLTEEQREEKIKKLINNLDWLISFSAKLEPRGPWPHDDENKKRQGHSKLILCRIPNLRILSVDLGHRYAAACAVWETMTSDQIKDECEKASQIKEKNGEAKQEPPSENDLYFHLKTGIKTHKKSKNKENNEKIVIYRRIGADKLPDGNEHPAPWAKLERQFLIKLQGEDKDARKASPVEIEFIKSVKKELGYVSEDEKSLKVDDLMSDTVYIIKQGIKRHGRRAKIAFNMITDEKTMPGGKKESLINETRKTLILDTLIDWYDLIGGGRWKDATAEELWNSEIMHLLGNTKMADLSDENINFKDRKKRKEDNKKKLETVAQKLAKNESNRKEISELWSVKWSEDDDKLKKMLRRLRDWILPRKNKFSRNTGGLSLTRIATIKLLYQVQKAFFTRFQPDGNHATAGEGFGQSILDDLDNMRENRVKQLASRIAEAALGIGIEREGEKGKDPKRPRERLILEDQEKYARFAPCHAVVIENLTHYRPEQIRTRRENRQLMDWSSAKVRDFLQEACELNCLHLRMVQAGYTSRQDSRTGSAGVRCQDIPVKDFIESKFWTGKVNKARQNVNNGKKNCYDEYLVKAYNKYKQKLDCLNEEEKKKLPPVRIPVDGGEIFVSSNKNSPASKGIQADLNAAANIGLKALLDHDWEGKWWFVPCYPETYMPIEDKVKGSQVIDLKKPLIHKDSQNDGTSDLDKSKDIKGKKKKEVKKTKSIVNLWRDPSSKNLQNDDGESANWQSTPKYWNKIKYNVIKILSEQFLDKP